MVIAVVPKKACISEKNTSIFEKFIVAVLCKTELAGGDDAMRDRTLVSMKMTRFPNSKDQRVAHSHQEQSQYNYYKAQQY